MSFRLSNTGDGTGQHIFEHGIGQVATTLSEVVFGRESLSVILDLICAQTKEESLTPTKST